MTLSPTVIEDVRLYIPSSSRKTTERTAAVLFSDWVRSADEGGMLSFASWLRANQGFVVLVWSTMLKLEVGS